MSWLPCLALLSTFDAWGIEPFNVKRVRNVVAVVGIKIKALWDHKLCHDTGSRTRVVRTVTQSLSLSRPQIVQRSCQRFVAFVQCKPGAVGSQALLPLTAVPGTQEQPTLPTNPTWTRLTGMKKEESLVAKWVKNLLYYFFIT